MRQILKTVGAFGVLVMSTFLCAQPAGAAVFVTAHEFNMCSQHCRAVRDGDPASLVVLSVALEDNVPWVITLNEVCTPEYEDVRDYLITRGYTPQRGITKYQGGQCGQYGNALFYQGVSVGVFDQYWLTPPSPSAEPRKLGCHRVNTYSGQLVHCVGHAFNSFQGDEVIWIMNATYGSTRRFFGGDLNKIPNDLNGAWYGGNNEADPAKRWTYDTFSATTRMKLDYIFVSHGALPGSPGPYCNRDFSDHCYFVGEFVY